MDRCYADALDIEWLARSVNLSRAHFIRSFRETFGETPHRYLQRRRLERAMALLRETDRSVTDICLDVGFSSLGTFSRTFREVLGESPREYRRRTQAAAQQASPLLPVFDHLFSTLVGDLGERGLLDDTLVIAMGEFGRTPKIGTQDSTDGRDHWPVVMSMVMAGGGFRHGQVIGATERDGGAIKERPVSPGDIAATIYHHMGVPLDATYLDHQGRPRYIVENGEPIRELI